MSDIAPATSQEIPSLSATPTDSTGAGGVVALAQPPVAVAGPSPAARRLAVRFWCTFVFAICACMLGIGAILTPNPKGMETHRQLGLPPCGFYLTTGLPCPTCGCTTAVARFAHGQFILSFLTQPFGFVVALLALLLIPMTGVGMVSGRWPGPSMFTLGWYWPLWIYGGLGVLGVAWVYKIIMVRAGYPIA